MGHPSYTPPVPGSRVFRWAAWRSGAHITVVGVDAAGAPLKVAGVEIIQPLEGALRAIDHRGAEWTLDPEDAGGDAAARAA